MRGAHETPHGWSWLVNTSIYSGIRSTERSSSVTPAVTGASLRRF
jgi:hypothetical protein